MVKTYQNLELFVSDSLRELSILESRKPTLADPNRYSGRLQSRSTPKRIVLCRKAGQVVAVKTRGLRKSSSLTNGMSRARNKAPLREYGIEARGLAFSSSMRPSWTPPLMRSV
jgi:hypothetical protein